MSVLLKNQVYLVMDYETRSRANLRKVGSYEYANHPSTRILWVAWRIGTREELARQMKERIPAKKWSPAFPSPYGELKRALLDDSIIIVAANAFFEQVITRFVLSKIISDEKLRSLPPSRFLCVLSLARALALPGKLELISRALNLGMDKDMKGHRLMLKMSKPRKPSKYNPAIWHQKKSDLLRLGEYCVTDVDVETLVFLKLRPLIPAERALWILGEEINLRGFRVDRPLIEKALRLIRQELRRSLKKTRELTGGAVVSSAQRNATLKWLDENGLSLPNLQKKTVSDALESGLASGIARKLLTVRQEASKSSTAKYAALESRSRTDERIRDTQIYHVASTGRDGGAGVQPHNMPVTTIKAAEASSVTDRDVMLAIRTLADPDTDLDMIRLYFGNPLSFLSSCLRAMIIPTEGHVFIGGDFSGIELRVLFWVAKHEEGLAALRENRDMYCEQASAIYGRTISKKDKFERQLGKKAVLGSGFGMGKDKFFETCKVDGMEVTPELAQAAISSYRSMHHPVPRLWGNLERAAIAAVRNPGKKYKINRTAWWTEGKYLFCELPNGRRLSYYGPEVRMKKTHWGELKPALFHWGVEKSHWVFRPTWGGKLTENVVQAIARDFMVESKPRAEKRGYKIVLTVHDELLTEVRPGAGSVSKFEKIMAEIPSWGTGCPLTVAGWTGPRYLK